MSGRRIHIGYVVHSLSPGGTERLAMEMSLEFSKDRRLTVYCLDEPGAWASDLRARGITVEVLWRQDGFDPGVSWRLARLCRRDAVDLLHAHQCTPWFYAALSRLWYRRPRLLLEEHGRFHPEADKPLRRLVNRLLIAPLTHRFVAVSRDIRRRLVRYEGLRAADIDVVYNGIRPLTRLSADERMALRRELGWSDDDVVVGTVGRFDPIKNLPLLLRSAATVMAGQPRLALLLVGDGPERATVRALAESLGIAPRTVFTGYRPDARRVLQCLDLFVLPSFSEGTSMALLEAMACGIPVCVTDVGGNPEVVTDGETGRLVPSNDDAALADALADVMAAREKWQQMATKAYDLVSGRFSFERMLEEYDRIYRELAAGETPIRGTSI